MNQLQQDAQLFQTLSHPTRLLILTFLQQQDGTLDVETLQERMNGAGTPIKQSVLSHHLKEMRRVELVTYTEYGLRHYYSICPDACEKLLYVARHYTRQESAVPV